MIFVWIGGPDEGLWLLVVVGDEAIDGGLETDDAFEDAALEAPLGEDGEETLDGVEPTGRGGREMGAPARMTPQPFDHLGAAHDRRRPARRAVASTIRARQACFWGLLRSSTIACRRLRSVGLR